MSDILETAIERGPNYDWKHEAEHYRLECDKLRELLHKVEASGERAEIRYRNIELANKKMSRNDHVVFGELLEKVHNLAEAVDAYANAMAIALKAGIFPDKQRVISQIEKALAKVRG